MRLALISTLGVLVSASLSSVAGRLRDGSTLGAQREDATAQVDGRIRAGSAREDDGPWASNERSRCVPVGEASSIVPPVALNVMFRR
jgi:hypothetical protein